MTETILPICYTLLNVLMLILVDTRRITRQQYYAYGAISSTVMGIVSACYGWTVVLYLEAAVTALCAWWWWNGGGGDGTRRRLKSWASRFRGVRRTAPAGAR